MSKHPIAQSTRSPSVNLFAHRISHDDRNTKQTNQPGEPAHRQPRAAEMTIKAILSECDNSHYCREDRDGCTANVKGAGQRVALVNVSADSMCFISKNKSLRRSDFREVFEGIDSDKRAGWTVLF